MPGTLALTLALLDEANTSTYGHPELTEDLLQETWAIALVKLRDEGLTDPGRLVSIIVPVFNEAENAQALWAELREVSPSAELVTEGRIVAAGSLADRGEDGHPAVRPGDPPVALGGE